MRIYFDDYKKRKIEKFIYIQTNYIDKALCLESELIKIEGRKVIISNTIIIIIINFLSYLSKLFYFNSHNHQS